VLKLHHKLKDQAKLADGKNSFTNVNITHTEQQQWSNRNSDSFQQKKFSSCSQKHTFHMETNSKQTEHIKQQTATLFTLRYAMPQDMFTVHINNQKTLILFWWRKMTNQ